MNVWTILYGDESGFKNILDCVVKDLPSLAYRYLQFAAIKQADDWGYKSNEIVLIDEEEDFLRYIVPDGRTAAKAIKSKLIESQGV